MDDAMRVWKQSITSIPGIRFQREDADILSQFAETL